MISDDIYRSLVYAGAEYVSIAAISPELADHTVLIDGVSKTYAMTGWRIGYTATTAALSPLVKAMSKIQGQSTSNATHAAQVATFAALTGTQEPVETMRKAFDERRIEMVKLLRAIPNVKCREPKGAFYAFPDLVGVRRQDLARGQGARERCRAVRLARRCRPRRGRPGQRVRRAGPRAPVVRDVDAEHPRRRRPARPRAGDADVIRVLAIVAALGCQNADKDRGAGIRTGEPAVVLRLTPDAIEVEGKPGKHTFQLEARRLRRS